MAVRGGTTRLNAPLRVNGPAQVGIIRDTHPTSFILTNHLVEVSKLSDPVTLRFDTCFGNLNLNDVPVGALGNAKGTPQSYITTRPGDSDEPLRVTCRLGVGESSCIGKFIVR